MNIISTVEFDSIADAKVGKLSGVPTPSNLNFDDYDVVTIAIGGKQVSFGYEPTTERTPDDKEVIALDAGGFLIRMGDGSPWKIAGTTSDPLGSTTEAIARVGKIRVGGATTTPTAGVSSTTFAGDAIYYNSGTSFYYDPTKSVLYVSDVVTSGTINVSAIAVAANANSFHYIVNRSSVQHTTTSNYIDLAKVNTNIIPANSWMLLQVHPNGALQQIAGSPKVTTGLTTWTAKGIPFGTEVQFDGLFACYLDASARDMRIRTLSGTRTILWSSSGRFDTTGTNYAGVGNLTPVSVTTSGLLIDNANVLSGSHRVSVHNVHDAATGNWYRIENYKYSTTHSSIIVTKLM